MSSALRQKQLKALIQILGVAVVAYLVLAAVGFLSNSSNLLFVSFLSVLMIQQRRTRELEESEEILRQSLAESYSNVSALRSKEAALLEQNAKLQKATQAKSDFVSTISHEIRTPLNSIIGLSELMASLDLPKEAKQYVESINGSGRFLLTIINDILDLSKIEAGKLELDDATVDLSALLCEVQNDFKILIAQKGLKFEVKSSLKSTKLRGDAIRLRQVISNLLSNATKFTEHGRIELRLSQRENKLHCEVQDSGVGISEDSKHKLFLPFSQTDSSFARKYSGTGLGLSICKRLISTMEGEMGVKDAPGGGSIFYFEIPWRESHTANVQLLGMNDNFSILDGLKILVAEDHPTNQILITRQLARLGCQATIVSNGIEALTKLKQESFSLMIMDCQMPELDGFETTKQVRAQSNQPYRDIPILALTANALNVDRDRCIQSGMNFYLSKPAQLAELKTAILAALSHSPPLPHRAQLGDL